jgi:hypothetical protein
LIDARQIEAGLVEAGWSKPADRSRLIEAARRRARWPSVATTKNPAGAGFSVVGRCCRGLPEAGRLAVRSHRPCQATGNCRSPHRQLRPINRRQD